MTFSYSLTMMPDWFAAIENAWSILKPGGTLGAVDFYVARKHAGDGSARHGFLGRHFWPMFFSRNDVFLSPDHLPYLRRRFAQVECSESRGRVPYLPLLRAPYYTFIGKKAEGPGRALRGRRIEGNSPSRGRHCAAEPIYPAVIRPSIAPPQSQTALPISPSPEPRFWSLAQGYAARRLDVPIS